MPYAFAVMARANGIVDHHRRLVAVDIRELERLVVNHHHHTVVRREKRFESDFRRCWHDVFLSMSVNARRAGT